MIPNNITITDGVGTGVDLILDKISEQNGESVFVGGWVSVLGKRSLRFSVKHTVPADVTKKSSHLCKLTITRFTPEGALDGVSSVHMVFQNDAGVDPDTNAGNFDLFNTLTTYAPFMDAFKMGSY